MALSRSFSPVSRKRPRQLLLALSLTLAALTPADAAELTFSRIGSGDAGLQQFWQLTPEEAQRYRNIMAATGERYKTASPLAVLAIMADSAEDRDYYAKRAALHEHEMVKREIETAYLISEEMSGEVLMEKMTRFTDGLTGINTTDYVPDSLKPEWRNGDWLVLYIDDSCLTAGCIGQFSAQMTKGVPEGIKVERVLVLNSKLPLTEGAEAVINTWPDTPVQLYDQIEHHYLQRGKEKGSAALHVRARQLVQVLDGRGSKAATQAATGGTTAPATVPTAMATSATIPPATAPATATAVPGDKTATPAASPAKPAANNKTSVPATGKTTGGK